MPEAHASNAKAALRKTMRARRAALSEQEADLLSQAAQRHLMASSLWLQARSVALYCAVKREADTRLLLRAAWAEGKKVFLPQTLAGPVCASTAAGPDPYAAAFSGVSPVASPAVSPGSVPAAAMRFLPCRGEADLVPGRFGIPEPRPAAEGVSPAEGWPPDFILVPGLAFDRRGYRIGSGGGYYDRFFAAPSMQDCVRIGFAYGFQILDTIDPDTWDKPVSALATEGGLLWL